MLQILDFVFLWEDQALSILAIRGYRAALSMVMAYRGKMLSAQMTIQLLFRNFE